MDNYIYSDFDKSLTPYQNGNLKVLYDSDVIIQSIKNIMATVTNERVRNPLGSSLIQYLFEPMNDEIVEDIVSSIRETILRFEPRIERIRVNVRPNYDGNYYDINMSLVIKNIRNPVNMRTKLRSLGDFR